MTPEIDTEAAPFWFHEGQLAAWDSEAEETVCCCGTQGGKTAIQALWLLREIVRCYKALKKLEADGNQQVRKLRGRLNFLYVGPTLTLLDAQAIPLFEDLFVHEHGLGRLIKGNKPKFFFSPEGLAKLGMVGCKSCTVHFAYANASSNLESVTALAGVWDEGGQKENKLASYRAFNRRLKIARSLGMGRRLHGTTPYEWGWFKDHLVDPAKTPVLTGDVQNHRSENGKIELVNWPSWMSPVMSEDECRAELEKMPVEEWEMMYMGLFRRPRGKIYDCFDPDLNTCPRFKIPRAWPRYFGLDFGPIHTACIMFAQELRRTEDGEWGEPTGRYIGYREYKTTRKTDTETNAKAILLGEGPMVPAVAKGGNSTEDGSRGDFSQYGLYISKPIEPDVWAGITIVYGLLSTGRMVFFTDLPMVRNEFDSYSRELDEMDEPIERTIKNKASYHLMDAVRYIGPNLRTGPNRVETPRDQRKVAVSMPSLK